MKDMIKKILNLEIIIGVIEPIFATILYEYDVIGIGLLVFLVLMGGIHIGKGLYEEE